jgi:serine/threonine protein kinase
MSNPGRRELEDIFVTAAVILTAPDANLVDPDGRDAPDVTTLKQCVTFLSSRNRVPTRFSRNITPLLGIVRSLIQGKAKKRTEPLQFGNWIVTERLGSTDHYTEYRARNAFAGTRSGSVLLRVYQADPYLPEADREAQRARIANAYQALSRLPAHAGIVGAKDFFPTETEERFVLAIEDVPGQALRLHLSRPNLALTFDQKLSVARGVLAALAHAHVHEVVHRALNPTMILIGRDGRVSLTGFDFARAGTERSHTIAEQIVDELDTHYLAPECHDHPEAASPASDVFAAGLVFYELFMGEKPFADAADLRQRKAVFPERPASQVAELPDGMRAWLQALCAFAPRERPSATEAVAELDRIVTARRPSAPSPQNGGEGAPDYHNLPKGYALTRKYVVQERLGKPGAFGVVYKVFDTLADADRALKLILHDRHSTTERLKKEYRTLRYHLPPQEHVVKVIDADFLPGDGPPFLVFEFLDGLDVGEMIENKIFAPADGLKLAREVTSGLAHLHRHGVYHCDIKPRNLLWTDHGTKIIDFNVSVAVEDELSHGGGSRRYLPPDCDLSGIPTQGELADRDLYALSITLYEVITGRYPWDAASPPPGEPARDPRELSGFADLAPELVALLLKAMAPRRSERFASAAEFLAILEGIPDVRSTRPEMAAKPVSTVPLPMLTGLEPARPNTNPYVAYLLTLYSQSQRSNSGTRGLDALGEQLYVETALDRELIPAVLAGEFRLVIITGNAGDGKTAFLQKLAAQARDERAVMDDSLPNGCRFTLRGRRFLSNYDGSQDEGDQPNEAVLDTFFAPFQGADAAAWPNDETRLIAINEGRLIDFFASRAAQFPCLAEIVRRGLATGVPETGIAVVNLNWRSVIADAAGEGHSILERLVERMTHETLWAPCLACDLKDKCYVHHNVRTFQDPAAGPRVLQRLKTLYTLTHLRGRLHITLRDLRSALAYMLVGMRDCDEIHALYASGKAEEIVNGFYFNSWMGGDTSTGDRLLALLREVDVSASTSPRLDRQLDYISPAVDRALMTFEQRGTYDRDILHKLFADLPRGWSGKATDVQMRAHRWFVSMARRRYFFECRDDERWSHMLPYRAAWRLLEFVTRRSPATGGLHEVLSAMNRGEDLVNPARVNNGLALQVRTVEGGSIRSYRVFPHSHFRLEVLDEASRARFVEHMPSGVVLWYEDAAGGCADLRITLDIFEMLHRLNEGYRPTVEEMQGYYLSLAVFKNVLASSPYQEILLTVTGHDFYRIEREPDTSRLRVEQLIAEGS